jgi:hypothetical protein
LLGYLVRRILTAVKNFKTVQSPVQPLQILLQVLAESGVLYFSTTIAHLAVWFTPSNLGIRILSEIVRVEINLRLSLESSVVDLLSLQNIPTIGIAFNIILIRAAENRAREAIVEEAHRNGVSVIRYADNNALPSKGKVIISQQTSMTSYNSELGGYITTHLPSGSHSTA